MVGKIITTFIRPTLEYTSVAWNPHKQKDIKKIERIQRAATRWVPELRELRYEERLQALNLTTLEARRKRVPHHTIQMHNKNNRHRQERLHQIRQHGNMRTQ